MAERRFPPPWTVEALDGGFQIVDAKGQALAYVYGHADQLELAIAPSHKDGMDTSRSSSC